MQQIWFNVQRSPPIHSGVEDCALLVGAILCREKLGSTFACDTIPLRKLQNGRNKQAGGDEITIVDIKRETDHGIEEIGFDNSQSARRRVGETSVSEGQLLYQGTAISK